MSIESKLQDYEREPVPLHMRKGWLSISLIWIAIGIDLSAMLLGAELGAGMPFNSAILAVLVGSLFLGLLSAFCAYIGTATGLSTSMISRYAFGGVGAKLISIVIGISLLGWFGVQAGFFAENAYAALNKTFGIQMDTKYLAVIGGLLMMSTAIVGYRAIEKLSGFSVPLLVILIITALFLVLLKNGAEKLWVTGDTTYTFGMATSLVIGIFVVGAIISPDISRWAKTKKDAILGAFIGFFFGNSFMLIMAIILSKTMGTDDLTAIFLSIGLGLPAILVLVLAQWTTNTNNLYSSALSLSVIFKNIPKPLLTLVAGLIATFLAYLGIYDRFITFLSIITLLIAPVGGIYTAEYYFVNKEHFKFSGVEPKPVIYRALIVWGISSLLSYATTPNPDGMGLFSITTIPALDGFLAALILHSIIGKLILKNTKPVYKEFSHEVEK